MEDSPIVPEFNSWLEELVKGEGSDLHVKVGSPPMLRLPHGLVRLERDASIEIPTDDQDAALRDFHRPADEMIIVGRIHDQCRQFCPGKAPTVSAHLNDRL